MDLVTFRRQAVCQIEEMAFASAHRAGRTNLEDPHVVGSEKGTAKAS
jgi:hypothetical protein